WPYRNEWTNETERLRKYLDQASLLDFSNGPRGLGMRTYFGPHYTEQFGRELLLSVPAPSTATELDWGGIRIDLIPEPWLVPEPVLVAAFQSAMDHLAPAKVLAEPIFYPPREVKFRK